MQLIYQQLTSLPVAEKKIKIEFILKVTLFLPWAHMKPNSLHGPHIMDLKEKETKKL